MYFTASFFTCVRREVGDQILVGVADHVEVADPAWAQVESGVAEVLQQGLEPDVAFSRLTQVALAVERDVAEDALEFALVRLFNPFQSLVDDLAQVALVALGVKVGERGAFG